MSRVTFFTPAKAASLRIQGVVPLRVYYFKKGENTAVRDQADIEKFRSTQGLEEHSSAQTTMNRGAVATENTRRLQAPRSFRQIGSAPRTQVAPPPEPLKAPVAPVASVAPVVTKVEEEVPQKKRRAKRRKPQKKKEVVVSADNGAD